MTFSGSSACDSIGLTRAGERASPRTARGLFSWYASYASLYPPARVVVSQVRGRLPRHPAGRARHRRCFWVHLPVAVAVLIGALHGVSRIEWAVLVLCITIVLAAEAFNTALEFMARAVTQDENEDIRHALDVAGGAVLITSIGAVAVGSVILLARLAADISRWLE